MGKTAEKKPENTAKNTEKKRDSRKQRGGKE